MTSETIEGAFVKILSFTFETALHFSEPVSEHSFVLRCLPASTPCQTILDCQVIIAPRTPVAHQMDGFGNRLQVGRIEAPHTEFSFVSSGMAVVDDGPSDNTAAEEAHPMYANPSAFAAADDAMAAFARETAGDIADPWQAATALSEAVHERIAYEKDVTDVSTTAAQAFSLGCGVCQDFAHILVALLRSREIPARYVNGLIIGEGATHAWVEVHDGTHWRGIDPTHGRAVNDTYIKLSHGRDFSDCPIETGVFRGGAQQDQRVFAQVLDQASQQQ